MISRVSSHLVFCQPDNILRQAVVERDENQTITVIFSLIDKNVETAQTLFFDGVISAGIVSLKLKLNENQLIAIREKYNYVDFSIKDSIVDLTSNKLLLIDFGTENLLEINNIFQRVSYLSDFPLIDFIAACVYYPALLSGRIAVPDLNVQTELLLWEQVDLVNKFMKPETRIHKI